MTTYKVTTHSLITTESDGFHALHSYLAETMELTPPDGYTELASTNVTLDERNEAVLICIWKPDEGKTNEPVLGEAVNLLRKRQGLTKLQLAQKIGVSPTVLNDIEHSRRDVSRVEMFALADELDVPVDFLRALPRHRSFDALPEHVQEILKVLEE